MDTAATAVTVVTRGEFDFKEARPIVRQQRGIRVLLARDWRDRQETLL